MAVQYLSVLQIHRGAYRGRLLSNVIFSVIFYGRYVDDTFVILGNNVIYFHPGFKQCSPHNTVGWQGKIRWYVALFERTCNAIG